MDKALRNALRLAVTQSRRILEESIGELLQGQYGIHASGKVEDAAAMTHLTEEEQQHREQLLVHLEHIQATGFKPKDAVTQLVREIAYTHMNRLCAYKMMETRHLIREAVSRGVKSNGFIFYLAEHKEDEQLWSSGKQDVAYRHFLMWLGETLSEEIGVLFSPHDSASRLFPPYHILERVLELLNSEELKDIWSEDETIGWVYQYFTPKELRDQARKESQAPRNSYELAFRNQFYTPRYVVQFLTENTLGRTWYEMRQGNTRLKEQYSYLVCRPDEVFLAQADSPEVEQAQRWLQGEDVSEPDLWPLAHTVNGYARAGEFGEESSQGIKERLPHFTPAGAKALKTQELLDLLFLFCRYERFNEGMLDSLSREIAVILDVLRVRVRPPDRENRSQEELLRAPFFIPYRPKKDPREIRILDPACGSGHFLLYCFDLLEIIYEEAYEDPELSPNLQKDYATLPDLKKAAPGLILAHNLHGIDIDLRATQIAALALWLRAQRAYQVMSIKDTERPKITRSNIVCAEPMPGEKYMLEEFIRGLQPMILGNLVRTIFEKMQLASEAGSLLKIEEEIKEAVLEAKQRWILRPKSEQLALWPEQAQAKLAQPSLFEGITNKEFWNGAEERVIDALHRYAQSVSNGRGLARQLFADDVVQGFAFIDICQKRYDVVLMNPPFGSPSLPAENYLHTAYPNSPYEIYGQFLLRATSSWCTGYIGAITSRGFLYLANFVNIRDSVYPFLSTFLDLGGGVLDSAFVEVCAYILNVARDGTTVECFDARNASLPFEEVRNIPGLLFKERGLHIFDLIYLASLPTRPFCYDTPPNILRLFESDWTIETATNGLARVGLATGDNERFVRCYWEVPKQSINFRWRWHAKGGEYLPFKPDVHLVVDWMDDGRVIEESFVGARIKKSDVYFRPGITYSRRSLKGLSFRILPSGCICGEKGPVIISPDHEYAVLALTNSSPFKYLVEIQSSASAFEIGLIQKVPVPRSFLQVESKLKEYGRSIVEEFMSLIYYDETDVHFQWPPFWRDITSIKEMIELLEQHLNTAREVSRKYLEKIDEEVLCAYNWPLKHNLRTEYDQMLEVFNISDQSEFVCRLLLSVCVGCVFGEFPIKALKQSFVPTDPYAPLPQGRLVSCQASIDNRNDILVDDLDSSFDIARSVQSLFELVYGENAESIEQEICQILGIKELRDYFSKPGNGGFWMDHIKCYSKSRRKAPIYWLLQSSKKNYALWLYYHRLDKDTLFKALTKYVEPKIRLEDSLLEQWRAQLASAGIEGREVKQLERQLERQESLVAELYDFRDKLRRAADLNLEPDLDDGVVLNIAPLRELVPWGEAKKYWEELLAGKYEWSSISNQLRNKGVI